jgi:plasmid stabilization system protein ParE
MKHAFSREARGDLVRLRAFIEKHGPAAAQRAGRRLVQGIERLVRHPRLGKRVLVAPGQPAPEEIRDWLVSDYVVRYLIANERVIVLRIWHGNEQRP